MSRKRAAGHKRPASSFRRLAAFCLLLGAGCPQKDPARVKLDPPPNQVIEDFRLTETNQGRLFYDLHAERAFVYEDSHRIDVVRPRVRFYDDGRRVTSVLTADAGGVDTRSSNLKARGGVRVATRDSTILLTDSLVWVNSERKVMTDAEVRMQGPSGTIQGRGLVSDAELKRVELKQTIQATTYDAPAR